MTAGTTTAPLRDSLAWLLDDAIRYREPDREGCCQDGKPCGDHAGDQVIADAVSALLAAIERADSDDAASVALRKYCPLILAAVIAATRDDEEAEGSARDDG